MDFVRSVTGTTPPKELLTFCKRELMHGAWRLLLDNEFKEGWTHGWVVKCADGVTRRIFPRIFTYSADYPEKCAIPCPNKHQKTNYYSGHYSPPFGTRVAALAHDVLSR
jgi:hypothetical protein